MNATFGDAECASRGCLGVDSLSSIQVSVQTLAIQYFDMGSGHSQYPEACTTTDVVDRDNMDPADFDASNILDLARIMVKELEIPHDAFTGFEPLRVVGQHGISYKYTLTCDLLNASKLQCVDVSWNATGSMICGAFGRADLCGWCEDSGVICCWSLFRGDFRPDDPSHALEYSSCFTVIACHPSHPSLLAAGTFSGEILIYDLSSPDDSLRASTEIHEYFHREPITALHWERMSVTTENTRDSYQLVSLSGDGKILWWSLDMIEVGSEAGGCLPHPVRHLMRLD